MADTSAHAAHEDARAGNGGRSHPGHPSVSVHTASVHTASVHTGSPPVDLTVDLTGGRTECEREDAARNRRLLMQAAMDLVAKDGVDTVTMEAVAARAGVGKGTLFRRFGSRTGLMRALLDHTETELQNRFMFGPPPLGPGAEPVTRIIAFGHARFDLVDVQGDVLRAAEGRSDDRFGAPARAVSLMHVTALLRGARVSGDTELLAHAILAPLEAPLVLHQMRTLGMTPERLRAAWVDLVHRITR